MRNPFSSPNPITVNYCNLFALIIGIDHYLNRKQLHGAVADAKDMKRYLEESLGVPSHNIRTLLDSQATRSKIIDGFKHLQGDQRIKEGDPIVIFFAGHGGELHTPVDWNVEGNKVQCLVPHDYEAKSIHPIPDYTIGALINRIAAHKRNNITVIFDCCHSAGGARAENDGYVPRTVDLNRKIPRGLDKDIWEIKVGEIRKIGCLTGRGLESHVLLAACRETEFAYESDGRGLFTSALLRTLRNNVTRSLTYAEVIGSLQISDRQQNPQCIGVHQHYEIFSMVGPTGARVRYPVRVDEGRRCIIGAGRAHGVSDGVEFTLYSISQGRWSRLGVIGIGSSQTEISEFHTTFTKPRMQFGNASFAMLTRVGGVPLYLQDFWGSYSKAHKALRDIVRKYRSAQIVEKAEMAKLEMEMKDKQIVFKVLDWRVKGFGLRKLPYTATFDNVAEVLNAAAHYYWYLDLANRERRRSDKGVVVDLHLLKDEYDCFGLPYMEAVSGPGIRQQGSADRLDVIELVVTPNAHYGIKITNTTQNNFYVNVFLFNNSTFRIVPYYTQSAVGNPEASLKANNTLSIGYGAGGTKPLTFFFLKTGQDVDVAYLAVFFATRPIDLTDIGQKSSPFLDSMNRSSLAHIAGREGDIATIDTDTTHRWFTIVIPIVQRAGATAGSTMKHIRPTRLLTGSSRYNS